jgi:5-methylcytosine-specific restriction enzyme subunit McrC
MSRTVELTESQGREVDLTREEAEAIARLGVALASKKQWWGVSSDSDAEASGERSAISCEPTKTGRWRVCVNNAIGAFGTACTTFVVRPKIPANHALHILGRSTFLPRLDLTNVTLAEAEKFFDLIARWFIEQTKEVIARDLLRDYEEQYGALTAVRGQIDPIPSAEQYYSGTLDVVCRYEEFTVNNAYNRLLLAAAIRLQNIFVTNESVRREARRLSNYFTDVGGLHPNDIDVVTDRRSFYYADALALAKLIIRSASIDLFGGVSKLWTFLIRTPEAIEDGIRNILRNGLTPIAVSKYGTTLSPSSLLIEPDLRFDPLGAIGDCKYKIYRGEWPRGDLYQSVAFAAGARTQKACVISFAVSSEDELEDAHFGDIVVRNIRWRAHRDVTPAAAQNRLVDDCRQWLFGSYPEPESL